MPDQLVCWTRMQSEAGHTLEEIIARKETERRANDGIFLWGVGNAPATAIRNLARTGVTIPVIFSVMKGRPKKQDSSPARVVAWKSFIDMHGIELPLPANSIVLSRYDSATAVKHVHYALMCHSDAPLHRLGHEPFDPDLYRNYGGQQAPVGASQVTALLKRVDQRPASLETGYSVDLRAKLIGSYWVKVTRPSLVSIETRERVAAGGALTIEQWSSLSTEIRNLPQQPDAGSQRLL